MRRDARPSTRREALQAPPLEPRGAAAGIVHILAARERPGTARLRNEAPPFRGLTSGPAARDALDDVLARVPAASLAGAPEAHRTW